MIIRWFNRLALAYFALGLGFAIYADPDNVLNPIALWYTDLDYPLSNLLTLISR